MSDLVTQQFIADPNLHYFLINMHFSIKQPAGFEPAGTYTQIYFNRVNGEYGLILQKKEETGVWEEIPFRDKYQWLFCYRR